MSRLAANGTASDTLLTHVLGIALLVASGASLLRAIGWSWRRASETDPGPIVTSLLGFVVGVLVGFTSIGAGSLLMAVFALLYKKLAPAKAVGVDVMHGAVLATVAAIAHGSAGHVELPMLFSLLTGSLPGVVLGGWLCHRLPSRPLRVGVAAMLAITGVRLL
jgi:hypothetical protein